MISHWFSVYFVCSIPFLVYTVKVWFTFATDLPDLVPDLGATVRSLSRTSFVVPRSIRDLACAIEEGCLSSSADTASSNTGRFLLRFDSLTMNWGNTDFLPNRDRSQWQFHKCHNHFHSFETFINYDLLNPSTGDKAAEGHKASFCLEDSFCVDGGPRLGYAFFL